MNWLDKLERKYHRFAIKNLMLYVIILYALGFVIYMVNPFFYYSYLCLDAEAILHGQLWRMVTFIINPPSYSIIWLVVALSLYYFIGKQLEATWGSFKFNVFFFSGMLFHVLAAIIVYLITGVVYPLDTTYLNMSLFLVFAALYPDVQFMVYFVIPVKGKWLAWIDVAYIGYAIVQAFLPAYGGSAYGIYYKANAIAAIVSLLNFLIFFMSTRMKRYSPSQVKRRQTFKKEVKHNSPVQMYGGNVLHRCAVCGRTDKDHPELEFRYCSKCNGNFEYCQDHLFTHEHVK